MRSRFAWAIGVVLAVATLAVVAMPPQQVVVGSYRTPFDGRSEHQRLNALRAAQALDGAVIAPGAVLSFNHVVGPWTSDRGYLKAPVSYSGEIEPAWGGGVCQTSTALYNAALLAGLEIIERHRHEWAPQYAPLGRDAAVAQYDIDLRIRNPHPWPVRLQAQPAADSLGIAVLGRRTGPLAEVQTRVRAVLPPGEVVRIDPTLLPGECHRLSAGRPGYRVLVYRLALGSADTERELVSEDRYPPMNRVVTAGP